MLLSLSFPITLDANGHLVEAKLDKILSKDKKMSHFESNNTSVFFCLLIKVMFEVMIKTAASTCIIGGYFRSKEIYGYGLKHSSEKFVSVTFVWNSF